MFIRIEPSSSVPIYRQIVDQIKYQIATGNLSAGYQMPSVRELAHTLAVNQNTILKVYNLLCRQGVLEIERGSGTFVASGVQTLRKGERREIVSRLLREAAVQAVHFDMTADELRRLLDEQHRAILSRKEQARSDTP